MARVDAGKRASLSEEASSPSLFSSLATACAPPRCVEREETKTSAPLPASSSPPPPPAASCSSRTAAAAAAAPASPSARVRCSMQAGTTVHRSGVFAPSSRSTTVAAEITASLPIFVDGLSSVSSLRRVDWSSVAEAASTWKSSRLDRLAR
eukprot:scaffold113110_cov63-Phaeocystis_antarctica.AAC.1